MPRIASCVIFKQAAYILPGLQKTQFYRRPLLIYKPTADSL